MKKLYYILTWFLPVFTIAQPVITGYRDSAYTIDTTYKICTPGDSAAVLIKHISVPVYAITVIPATTTYGILAATKTESETEIIMNAANINLVRAAVYFYQNATSKSVDKYLQDGFNVAINFNYEPTTSPVPFPKDTAFIRRQAEAFFKYYSPRKDQIPIIVVENEWDNKNYHSGSINDYLTELKIVTEVGHKYGFKVSDAGITSTALQRWTYSKLNGDSASWWRAYYFIGLNQTDYKAFIASIDYYASAVKNIGIDYLNFHWYNVTGCAGGLPIAISIYQKACGKPAIITNEFGTENSALWPCTVSEIKQVHPVFAIGYSGINTSGKAVSLTNEMLQQLK